MTRRLMRPRIMSCVVSAPGEAACAMLTPRGGQLTLAEVPFVRRAFRRDVLDATALTTLIKEWKPDVLTTRSDDHFPDRAVVGLAMSRGIVEGVLAASGMPIAVLPDEGFCFYEAVQARRLAISYWPQAIEQLALGSRALADAALLANTVRDPRGFGFCSHILAALITGIKPVFDQPDPPKPEPQTFAPTVYVHLEDEKRASLLLELEKALSGSGLRGWNFSNLAALRNRLKDSTKQPTKYAIEQAERILAKLEGEAR